MTSSCDVPTTLSMLHPRSSRSRLLTYCGKLDQISTFNDADVETVFSSDEYRVDVNDPDLRARISLVEGGVWPTDLRPTSAVKIVYTAGYGLPSTGLPEPVPEDLKLAILMTVAYWYQQREAACSTNLSEVPLGARYLLDQYRQERI